MAIFAHSAQMCKMVIKSGKIYVFSALIVVCILVAAGCERVIEATTQDEIVFEPSLHVEVKGIELSIGSLTNFGVFATLEENGEAFVNSDNLQAFMDNVRVEKISSSNSTVWSTNPKYYWPVIGGKKLSFFAYAPHNRDNSELLLEEDWTQGNKNITITYTPSKDPVKHVDLCVAAAVLDRDNISDRYTPISFIFEHTLSWVTFGANYEDKGSVLPSGCYVRIDEITLSNLIGENTLVFNSSENNFYNWGTSAEVSSSVYYTLSLGSALANVKLIEKEGEKSGYSNIVAPGGYLFLIPQSINPQGSTGPKTEINVKFSFVRESDDVVIAQFEAQRDLPPSTNATEWISGRKIVYNFTVDLNNISLVNITPVTIENWVESGNVHNGGQGVEIK